MKVILATGNKNKAKEFKEILKEYLPDQEIEVSNYTDFIDEFEIEENGDTFQANSLIKAKAIYEKLKIKSDEIILSDDSGICVEALNDKPNIYSARFYQEGLSSKEIEALKSRDKDSLNRAKLIESLKLLGLKESPAYFVCAITLISSYGTYTSHGFMSGKVHINEKGENGFGYDSLFTPNGYDKRAAELDKDIKNKISHRRVALDTLIPVFRLIKKKINK